MISYHILAVLEANGYLRFPGTYRTLISQICEKCVQILLKKNVTAFVTHVKNAKCDKCVMNTAVSQGLAVTVYGGDCNTL